MNDTVRPLGSVPISQEDIQNSKLYQRLIDMRMPEPFAELFGEYDQRLSVAFGSMQDQVARVIDSKAAQLRLDSYIKRLSDQDRTDEEVEESIVVGQLLNPPQPITLPARIAPGAIPRPAAPAPGQVAGGPVNELVYPISGLNLLGGHGVLLQPLMPVALIDDAGVVKATLGHPNTAIGIARSISNGYVTISLAGDRSVGGFSGLVPGLVYYLYVPAPPGQPYGLALRGDLPVGGQAKGIFRSLSATEVRVLDWEPFFVAP